jgi:hypothetical protein
MSWFYTNITQSLGCLTMTCTLAYHAQDKFGKKLQKLQILELY